MERALITRDFSVSYVAENGSHATPALFNVATLWAALEGSILLWALILAGYLVLVAYKFANVWTIRWWDGPWRCCSSCACSSSC